MYYLWVLLRDVLLGEFSQLDHLRDDLFLVIAVGAVHQCTSNGIQDSFIFGLQEEMNNINIRVESVIVSVLCI